LDLQAVNGSLDVRRIDIATSEWGKREPIKGGGVVALTARAKRHWVAAIVKP